LPAKKEVFKNFRQVLSLEPFFTHIRLSKTEEKFRVIYTLKSNENVCSFWFGNQAQFCSTYPKAQADRKQFANKIGAYRMVVAETRNREKKDPPPLFFSHFLGPPTIA